jgi:hypothetical protein
LYSFRGSESDQNQPMHAQCTNRAGLSRDLEILGTRFANPGRFRTDQNHGRQRAEDGKRRSGAERPPEPLDKGGVRRLHGTHRVRPGGRKREVQLALRRREQEQEPPVVFDGRLRHPREDAALRRAPGGQTRQTQQFRGSQHLVAIDRRATGTSIHVPLQGEEVGEAVCSW